ncbi:hypothetical protein LU699_08650 [Luteimonas fraxinea]|uniref:Polyprenyl synthetase n=2 Tax=Luteimonas fraxinea TaxID=2901869 RepID=A0ABS8UDB2_9GAMM|nr:hypothetical protein [Luteimonas fraxinea]MCD9097500.1 hypothetical protein [Luteimonas fraxinea]UHH11750.1 hypothetical protein LU699_08650 [Luteimonas fraxinea]
MIGNAVQRLIRNPWAAVSAVPVMMGIGARWPVGDRLPSLPAAHARTKAASHGAALMPKAELRACRPVTPGAQYESRIRSGRVMELEALLIAALREAGYGPDAIGSAMPRIIRIMQAEDVRIEMGRSLSRKEREYVRLQLELGLNVSEVVAGLQK